MTCTTAMSQDDNNYHLSVLTDRPRFNRNGKTLRYDYYYFYCSTFFGIKKKKKCSVCKKSGTFEARKFIKLCRSVHKSSIEFLFNLLIDFFKEKLKFRLKRLRVKSPSFALVIIKFFCFSLGYKNYYPVGFSLYFDFFLFW